MTIREKHDLRNVNHSAWAYAEVTFHNIQVNDKPYTRLVYVCQLLDKSDVCYALLNENQVRRVYWHQFSDKSHKWVCYETTKWVAVEDYPKRREEVGKLVTCNMTHGSAKQELINAMQKFEDFHSRRGTQSNKIMCCAYNTSCNKCNQYTLYIIKSYSVVILSYCHTCEQAFIFDDRFYSKTTLTVQRSIAEAYPHLNLHYRVSWR